MCWHVNALCELGTLRQRCPPFGLLSSAILISIVECVPLWGACLPILQFGTNLAHPARTFCGGGAPSSGVIAGTGHEQAARCFCQ